MDYNAIINIIPILFSVMAALVFVVNIIVELTKNTFPKLPTSILTIILSEVITVVAFFAWVTYAKIAYTWYFVVGAVLLGLFVAYAAMFGFDKFKDALEKLRAYKAQ